MGVKSQDVPFSVKGQKLSFTEPKRLDEVCRFNPLRPHQGLENGLMPVAPEHLIPKKTISSIGIRIKWVESEILAR